MRRRLTLAAAGLLVLGALLAAILFVTVWVRGPRMRAQPSLRTFEAALPGPPEGSLPVEATASELPPAAGANPLQASPENLARGRVYYRYYCLACHGEDGAGHGPVGESYMPVPTDLRSDVVQRLADGPLRRAMLAGVGHEPVLPRVVAPEHRWYLVLAVRAMGEGGEAATTGGS